MAVPATTKRWLTRPDFFHEIEEMRREMNDLFTSFDWRAPWRRLEPEVWIPSVDMFEEGKELVVRADLPGIDPKDVKVTVEKDVLTIQGERKEKKEINEEKFFHREAMYGKYMRRVALQPGLKPEDMKASYKDGVLEVRFPRLEAPAPKEIPVQT